MPSSRRLLLAGLVPLLAAPALAQTPYPDRPVTMIASGAAGGPTDTITRIVADNLGKHLGRPVVVESIGGTIVGPQRLAQSRPDGYTLMINNISMAASATLYRKLPLVQHAAGAAATVVMFRGTAPAIAELMAGRVDLLCDQATNTVPYIRDGRVTAWGVSSPERLPGLPDVPTTAEAGFPGVSLSTWHGLYAPAGTPERIQERIAAALRQALREERLRQRFAELLTEPAGEERASIAFHRRFVAEEVARWRPVIQAANQFAN